LSNPVARRAHNPEMSVQIRLPQPTQSSLDITHEPRYRSKCCGGNGKRFTVRDGNRQFVRTARGKEFSKSGVILTAALNQPQGGLMARRKAIEPDTDIGLNTATDTDIDFDTAKMDAESQAEPTKKPFNPERSWSSLNTEQVKYRRLSDANLFVDGAAERGAIVFKFEPPKGKAKPDDEVIAVMREHKTGYQDKPTGLKFTQTRQHGACWVIPNDAEGRALADKIEQGLHKVADKIEAEQLSR
jgi:hypothetical protein